MYKSFTTSEQAQDVIRAVVDFSTRHGAIWLVARMRSGRRLISMPAPFDVDAILRAVDYEKGTVEITVCFTDREPKFYRIIL